VCAFSRNTVTYSVTAELANITEEPSLFLEYSFLSPARPVGLAERGSKGGRKRRWL